MSGSQERESLMGASPDEVWDYLPGPWRACVELAWESYRAGSLPIGAVVADAQGNILSRGRNRIHERSGEDGYLFGHKLAHAEINALVTMDYDRSGSCVLYTTTEPCPLCVGAVRMTDVKELRYAAREPWGGSAGMFETVPYLKRGNVRVFGPEDRRLEEILVSLQVERFLRLGPDNLDRYLGAYEAVMPHAVRTGRSLYRSGTLREMSVAEAEAATVLRVVGHELRAVA
ncbi:MAG TPA: nucleoside deaminase [Rubrobacter sp.]|nr:nucleoside deaminase [Rubrobacter sp.]